MSWTTTSGLIAMRSRGLNRTLEPFTGEHRPSILRRVPWWEWVLLLAFVLVCLAVAGPRAMAHVDCRVAPVPLSFGNEVLVTMTANANRPCTLRLRPAGATVGRFDIQGPPAHGSLRPRGRTGVIYRANREFRGEDAFDLALSGRSARASGTALIRVSVAVK